MKWYTRAGLTRMPQSCAGSILFQKHWYTDRNVTQRENPLQNVFIWSGSSVMSADGQQTRFFLTFHAARLRESSIEALRSYQVNWDTGIADQFIQKQTPLP